MRALNLFSSLVFTFFLLLSSTVDAQGYYKFSDKVSGDFSDEGRVSVGLYGGLGIPIAYTFSTEVEYFFLNDNVSVGIDGIYQKYSDETIFEYQGGENLMSHLFVKYSLYPSNGRFSFFGSGGMGIQINKQVYNNPYGEGKSTSLSYILKAGVKYKISRAFGVSGVLFYSVEPCASLGVNFSF